MQDTAKHEVKRIFLLADRMKRGPFESQELFDRSLANQQKALESKSESEIDIEIRDVHRIARYDAAVWSRGKLTFSEWRVWPKMGGREWAIGEVSQVAEYLTQNEEVLKDDSLWRMKSKLAVLDIALPIIAIDDGNEKRLDDGSHRAVAMALIGIREADAWIGKLSSPCW